MRSLNRIFLNKSLHRFLTLNCNCPCYKSRPQRRFFFRLCFLLLCCTLRLVATIIYSTVHNKNNDSKTMATLCGVSIIFIFLTLCMDLYHYVIWRYYIPQSDYRDVRVFGDGSCRKQPCHNKTLDYITVFHSSEYQPQDRWQNLYAMNDCNTPLLRSSNLDILPHS